jgi:alpha-tubulin suppressor-like RCC1 family protein
MACSNRLLDMLALDELTAVCLHLDLRNLIRLAQTCKRFRHGDDGLETVELPSKSPVVTALCELAFPGGELIPSARPIGRSESWVAYLARCVRQRRCREAPPIGAGVGHTLFVDATGRLLSCGGGAAVGHGDARDVSVVAMAGVQVRSIATESRHSLALGWDGRVFSWGKNESGQLGLGDSNARLAPALVEGLKDVRSIATLEARSLAVTQSGGVFGWGRSLLRGAEDVLVLRPMMVEGFGGVRVRRVCAASDVAFAIGEDGEVTSWGQGTEGRLGHGAERDQPSPKRVEALQGVRVSCVAVGRRHVLALAEDGLVYAWGENAFEAVLGNPHVERELLPKPAEALRGVRVGSVAAIDYRSYAVTDTGELCAWGVDGFELGAWGVDGFKLGAWGVHNFAPLGHDERTNCPLPKPIESLRGVKVDAVAAGYERTLVLADNGIVYAWGVGMNPEGLDALGLGSAMPTVMRPVLTPQLVPDLRVAGQF